MATFGETRSAARGRWSFVIQQLVGRHLDPTIETRGKKHVVCPVHGFTKHTPTPFRVFDDFEETGGCICSKCGARNDGFATIAWLLNIDMTEARNQVADLLGVSGDGYRRSIAKAPVPLPPQPPPPPPPEPDLALRDRLAAMYREAYPLDAPEARPARLYFVNRGIRGMKAYPRSLRYHPSVPYYEADEKGKMVRKGNHPAILAAVCRKSKLIPAIHRTYITETGYKALVPEVKKLTGAWDAEPLAGAFIPLGECTTILGVTEGIETALAVSATTFMPMWACISASLMQSVHIPEQVKTVVIWADYDKSGAGMLAAEKLRDRLQDEGRQVIIALPGATIPEGAKGIDWLDMLRDYGPDTFPYRDLDEVESMVVQESANAVDEEEADHGVAVAA